MPTSLKVMVEDSSQVGEARRVASSLAEQCGFDETTVGRVAILATEAAGNLLKHAGKGQILLTAYDGGLEILALDNGPGIADLAASMRDGFSTSGTPGTGLGALDRLADEFEIFTAPGLGTVLAARVLKLPREPGRARIAAVNVPIPGETVSGDGWAVKETEDAISLIMADGLGHGPFAHEAANLAVESFERSNSTSPKAILEGVHRALTSSRGAAVAVARLDKKKREILFSGIGNISAYAFEPGNEKARHLVSLGGTAGHAARKIQEFRYEWPPRSLVVFHSDGLQTRWKLESYPGLMTKGPALVAGALYRDFQRGTDDASVLAVRE